MAPENETKTRERKRKSPIPFEKANGGACVRCLEASDGVPSVLVARIEKSGGRMAPSIAGLQLQKALDLESGLRVSQRR